MTIPTIPSLRMVLFDADNTLVDGGSPDLPSERFQKAVTAVQACGIHVGLATGRQPQKSLPIIEVCGMNGWSILTNGAQIYDSINKHFITDYILPQDVAAQILRRLEQAGIPLWIQDSGVDHFWMGIVDHEGYGLYGVGQTLWDTKPSTEIGRYTYRKPYAIVAHHLSAEQKDIVLDWGSVYADRDVDTQVLHEYTENGGSPLFEVMFIDKRASKRTGLETIIQHIGSAQNVMAVGDSHNDTSLMEYVGWPVAVENAVSEISALAKFSIPSWRHDGPAQLLETLAAQRSS